ncbi:MAG: Na/Pi cotransporter family protein, partial [Bacteroidia bacterium]|nr:Na/Pi cotransporter family protein [Bacteroidia bacterium]
MQVVSGVLQLLGALGIFLYGMKMLSESLQKVAGERMRGLLSQMTSNRFKGILTGVAVTATIQSSSATSVMVVSFVNAGLLTLLQAAGVIMGANIGTTVTAWIISLLGFKVDISVLAVPLIGLTLPLIFSKHAERRALGELIFGFALLFMGLHYLKDSVPNLQGYPQVLEWLRDFSSNGIWSVLLFMVIGTVLTVVVQSSSAMVALTLIMCANGWIGFDMAAAMVLGENIGTTVTANIAAMVGNVSSRRAAMFHTLFNVCGVIWAILLFPFLLRFVGWAVTIGGGASPLSAGGSGSLPIGISLFHTTFNVLNTLVLVWFAPQLVKLTTMIIPQRGDSDDEVFRLKHIGIGMLSTGELSIVQARKESVVYMRRTYRMFGMVKDMFETQDEKEFKRLSERINKYETISDRVEIEIAEYLGQVNTTELSEDGGAMLQGVL